MKLKQNPFMPDTSIKSAFQWMFQKWSKTRIAFNALSKSPTATFFCALYLSALPLLLAQDIDPDNRMHSPIQELL